MRKYLVLTLPLALMLNVVHTSSFAQEEPNFGRVERVDTHAKSAAVGEAASQEGAQFVEGAKKIAEPFIVVGRTVKAGVAYVILKGTQGVVYVAEDAVVGLKYLKKGAKYVIIQTAKGIRYVAVQAIKAGEAVFDFVVDVGTIVIDDVEYVLIKIGDGFAYVAREAIKAGKIVVNGVEYVLVQLEDGVAFVAREAVKAGKVVVDGVTYVVKKTADGIVWVTESTWDAIKAGAAWTRDMVVISGIRARLSAAMLTGRISQATLNSFQSSAINGASERIRGEAAAAYAASASFNASLDAR